METPDTRPIEFEIMHEGEAPILKVFLPIGRSLFADAGSMMAMAPTLQVEGEMRGGLLGALSRKILRGETFFYLTVKAVEGDGEILFAPAPTGEMIRIEMDGSVDWYIQKGAFLVAEQTIRLETKMQNLAKGLFSGAGFFISRVAGHGRLILNTFGAAHRVDLGAGQEYIVDNNHLVAWNASMSYNIEKASKKGWIASILSGEGLVCHFKGPGTVYIQTRNPAAFAGYLTPYLPLRN